MVRPQHYNIVMKIGKAEQRPKVFASSHILVKFCGRIMFVFCFVPVSKLSEEEEVDRAGDIIRNIMYISSAPAAAQEDVKSTTTTGARVGTVFSPDWLKSIVFPQMYFIQGLFFLFFPLCNKVAKVTPILRLVD